MLELYYLEEADSICSNRPHMTLSEKGIDDWIGHKLVLVNGDQFKPEYLKLNPKAQVPTLVHDGRVIKESSIICNYIDDLKPDPALKPDDPVDLAQMQEWIKDCDESGYQATASLNFVTRYRLAIPIEIMEERWKKVTDLDRLHRQQSCIREGMGSLYALRAVAWFDRLFGKIELSMADGRPWLLGEQFTLAEINLAPFIKVAELLRVLDLFLEARPAAGHWWDSLSSRPSYQQLEDYPGQNEDDNAPHAVSGTRVRHEIIELLEKVRARGNPAY